MNKRIQILQKLLSIFIIVTALIGTYQTVFKSGEMGDDDLLYFTIQSNLWISGIHLYFLFAKNPSNTARTLKYVFTVCITLTFIVFFAILVPEIGWQVVTLPGSMPTHFWAPLAAIIHYLFFERKQKSNKQTIFYAIIPPLIYFIVILILSNQGVTFINDQPVPYFFLNFHRLGWFSIGEAGIGVVYWMIILLGLILLIAFGLLRANQAIRKRLVVKGEEYIQEGKN